MAKKLSCGYTLEEIDDMAETAGIESKQLHHALTYINLKRDYLKHEKAKKKADERQTSPELMRAFAVLLNDEPSKGTSTKED